MAYALDDEWENGPMIRKAGVAAFGLYCACGLWIARHRTDGFVPADVAADLGSREWAAKLVNAGFWEVVEGGFHDSHYLKRNPSAEQVEARRAADAKRKAEWRARKESQGQSKRSHGGTPNGTPRSPTTPKGVGGLFEAHPFPDGAHECDRCPLPAQHTIHRLLGGSS